MPKLTVLMGAPGSGKSTYAKKTGAHVVTTDGARAGSQTPAESLHNAYSQINKLLAAGKNVVFDTTGANPAVRKAMATIAQKHGAQLTATVIDTPVKVCVESQKGRTNPVSAVDVQRLHNVVQRQLPKLKSEGFHSVDIVRDRK